jgi:hypothetical protein
VKFYAMADASAHTVSPHARLRPHIGVIAGKGFMKSRWYLGAGSMDYDGDFDLIWGGQIQGKLSDQVSVFLELSKKKATKMSLELRWYW